MRNSHIVAIILVLIPTLSRAGEPTTQPTTQPFPQPQARRAQEVMQSRLAQLDAEYRVKQADILQHYADSLNEAKLTAMRAGDRDEAQKIFEESEKIFSLIRELAPDLKAMPDPKPLTPYKVKIRDFNGAAGFTEVVEVTNDAISVIGEDDFGHPPRVVWKGDLRPRQRKNMSAFMNDFPLDRLDNAYDDLNVNDGYEAKFFIQIGSKAAREIEVSNIRQLDLERLIDKVNDLLPPKYARCEPCRADDHSE